MRHLGFKKNKGFTLIEMLIVVAIVGILTALLIPNTLSAIQKARQKGTMKDMNSVASAIIDFITDNGIAPTGQPAGSFTSAFISALNSGYLVVVPVRDQWNSPFQAATGTGGQISGYSGVSCLGADDFIIASYGRDRAQTDFVYQPTSVGSVYFQMNNMSSFNQDLVLWNGDWVHVPNTSQSGT